LRYDDAAGLEARGIEVHPRVFPPAFWTDPQPVPVTRREFAQPPPGREPWQWRPWEWPAE
jgi:hypothetical protein